MNAVGKNLKALRQRAGLTQDALAERLHVTRQAVSSWETGKTQPDIETLTALAEALDADVRELIYGPEQAERPYTRFQRRYIICAAVCALVFLAWIVLELTLAPYLAELLRKSDILWPSYVYGVTGALFVYSAAGVFLLPPFPCGGTSACGPSGCGGRWLSWECCSWPIMSCGRWCPCWGMPCTRFCGAGII